jgi:hypothetical protein
MSRAATPPARAGLAAAPARRDGNDGIQSEQSHG